MKTKVTPLQSISQNKYIFWDIATKDKVEMVGGQLISVYCQCAAGLMALCNHISAMLLSVEAAILQGLTYPSCTSILKKWNIPKLKAKAEAAKLKKSVSTTPDYKKKATYDQEKSCIAEKNFLAFCPTSESQNAYVKDGYLKNGNKVRNGIFNSLWYIIINSSCFYELKTCSSPKNSC